MSQRKVHEVKYVEKRREKEIKQQKRTTERDEKRRKKQHEYVEKKREGREGGRAQTTKKMPQALTLQIT